MADDSGSTPLISVVIPTYNWSSALAVALESVRDQTLTDFEVLVVGDGCTDDSEAVVRSFGDGRLHWTNLAENHGNAWAAYNRGLELARAKHVAYLCHDDVWWPTHLEVAMATLERTGADMAVGVALFYGPRPSGMRGVTGCFPHDTYGPQLFVPPSSMAHRLDLVRRIGPWLPMEKARYSIDNDFVIRTGESGARIVPTHEATTFKFSAGWRRDSYLKRDASEQRECLDHIRREGEAFRRRELIATLNAAALDRFVKLEMPLDHDFDAMKTAPGRWAYKGSRRPKVATQRVAGPTRLFPEDDASAFEWYGWESGPLGRYRWSGPSTVSTVVLPLEIEAAVDVTLQVVNEIAEGTLQGARLEANGAPIAMGVVIGQEGARHWFGRIDPSRFTGPRRPLQITVLLEKTQRPYDLRLSEDRRYLGLAIGWIELKPAREEAEPASRDLVSNGNDCPKEASSEGREC